MIFCDSNIIIQSDVAHQMALIYHNIGKKDTAYRLLYKYTSKCMPANVVTKSSYNLGVLNFCDLKYDSAAFYFEKSFVNGNNLMKFSSAQKLAIIYDSLGDSKRASVFSNYALNNAVREINRNIKAKDLVNIYATYKTNQEEKKQKKEKLLYISLPVLLALLTTIPMLHLSKRKNEKLSEMVKKQGNTVRNLKSKNKKLEQEKTSITVLNKNYSRVDINECMNNYLTCHIGDILVKRVQSKNISKKNICDNYDIALTDSEKILVRSSANVCIPSFTNVLTYKLGIKGDSVLLCCLALLGFSLSEIAALMGITYQAANKRKNSIREKLGTDNDIVSFITAYMNDFYTNQKD